MTTVKRSSSFILSHLKIGVLRFALLAITLACCTDCVRAQPGLVTAYGHYGNDFKYTEYNTNNGLPQNNVNAMVQTPDGLMWIATFQGLVCFDGKTFRVFGFKEIKKLKSDLFIELFVDSRGTLWIVSETQILYYKQNTFYALDAPVNDFRGIAEINGRIYATYNGMIHVFNNHAFVKYMNNLSVQQSQLRSYGANLYVLKDRNTIVSLDSTGKRKPVFSKDSIVTYFPTKNGLIIFTKNNCELVDYAGGRKAILSEFSLNNPVVSFSRLNTHKGKLHLIQDSLYIVYDVTNGRTVTNKLITPSQINIQRFNMFVDTESNLWLLTNSDGLIQIQPKIATTYYSNPLTTTTKTGGSFVYLDHDKASVWYNGIDHGLFKLKNEAKKIKYELREVPFGTWSMLIDNRDSIWLTSPYNRRKAFRYDPLRNKTWTINVPDKLFYSVFQSSDNRIWLSSDTGIWVSNDYRTFKEIGKSLNLTGIYQFSENKNTGEIYVVTRAGLYCYNGNTWRSYTTNNGLPTNNCRAIYIDKKNTIWLGTKGFGLCCFKNGVWKNFPLLEGVLDKNVWAIEEDDYGYLWYSSNNGIYRVNKFDLEHYGENNLVRVRGSKFGVSDGIINSEFNSRTQNKSFKDRFGNLWFSSIIAPVKINPAIAYNTIDLDAHFPIKIVEVSVNGEPLEQVKDSIEIQQPVHYITLNVSSPNFNNHAPTGFKYSINNSLWNEAPNGNLTLNELKPGDYSIAIKQTYTDETTSVFIYIKPTLWQESWFRNLLLILAIASVIVITILITKQIQHKKNKRKNEINEWKLKLLQSQMNPHFIFNILGSIQSFVINKERFAASDYISDLASLIRINLNYAEELYIPFKEEIRRLLVYIKLEKLRFPGLNIDLHISDDIGEATQFPNMMIQPLIENAIIHAFVSKTSQSEKSIKVGIKKHLDQINITVEDNGLGYKQSVESKHGYRSIGIDNIKQRTALLPNGKFSILNKQTIAAKDTGTIVTIQFTV